MKLKNGLVLSKDDSKGITEPDCERKKENVAVCAHGFLIETEQEPWARLLRPFKGRACKQGST